MTDLRFSRDDANALVNKLGPGLTDEERNLLLAIFCAAAEAVEGTVVQVSADEASTDITEFHDQLIHSFLPDSGDQFSIPLSRYRQWRIKPRPHPPPRTKPEDAADLPGDSY